MWISGHGGGNCGGGATASGIAEWSATVLPKLWYGDKYLTASKLWPWTTRNTVVRHCDAIRVNSIYYEQHIGNIPSKGAVFDKPLLLLDPLLASIVSYLDYFAWRILLESKWGAGFFVPGKNSVVKSRMCSPLWFPTSSCKCKHVAANEGAVAVYSQLDEDAHDKFRSNDVEWQHLPVMHFMIGILQTYDKICQRFLKLLFVDVLVGANHQHSFLTLGPTILY